MYVHSLSTHKFRDVYHLFVFYTYDACICVYGILHVLELELPTPVLRLSYRFRINLELKILPTAVLFERSSPHDVGMTFEDITISYSVG